MVQVPAAGKALKIVLRQTILFEEATDLTWHQDLLTDQMRQPSGLIYQVNHKTLKL